MTNEVWVCEACGNTGLVVSPRPDKNAMRFCACDAGKAQMEMVADGIRDIRSGRSRPWSEVKNELGI